jgi:hypothetical protein
MCAMFAEDGEVEIRVIAFMYVIVGSIRRWAEFPLAHHDSSSAGCILALHNVLFFHLTSNGYE